MLTNENYFSYENQMKYMSASQFKSFMKCEAATIAEINGEYERPKTTALLVGSYFDAHFEGALDIFRAQHPEIFKKDGTLKADYTTADKMIERIERDPLFMQMMSGEKQVIKTGTIGGVPFKIKIDSYHPGKLLVDLKAMKNFESVWDERECKRVHFIEYWGYDYQGAIYQKIDGNKLPFFISAVTKESEPDIGIFSIPQLVLDDRLFIVELLAPKYDALKHGIGTPSRCEHCDYCKRTKKLNEIIDYTSLNREY